jgi:hypothetical protein
VGIKQSKISRIEVKIYLNPSLRGGIKQSKISRIEVNIYLNPSLRGGIKGGGLN